MFLDCCNSYGEGKQNMGGTQRQVITTTNNLPTTSKQHGNVMDMYKKAISTCHVDCEKLCLPACEFVCCVPSKMREIRFTKGEIFYFKSSKSPMGAYGPPRVHRPKAQNCVFFGFSVMFRPRGAPKISYQVSSPNFNFQKLYIGDQLD